MENQHARAASDLEKSILDWGMKHPDKNIRGARILELIQKRGNNYHLTPDGVAIRNIFSSLHSDTSNYLSMLKRKIKWLFEANPNIAYLIRLLYNENPDI